MFLSAQKLQSGVMEIQGDTNSTGAICHECEVSYHPHISQNIFNFLWNYKFIYIVLYTVQWFLCYKDYSHYHAIMVIAMIAVINCWQTNAIFSGDQDQKTLGWDSVYHQYHSELIHDENENFSGLTSWHQCPRKLPFWCGHDYSRSVVIILGWPVPACAYRFTVTLSYRFPPAIKLTSHDMIWNNLKKCL